MRIDSNFHILVNLSHIFFIFSPTPPLTMVCQKKLFVFFVIMMLGLLVPGPSMTGVEAMHLGGGGGGGMRGVELLLAAGIIAKLLDQHHHHHG
ncbi:hypothetical protein TNCT_551051 [Trichonephila clavata]|uniref:Transmembrane protein n=1 Tax=Trichonephila clavata TaxID=2740835 RepID=A0A8X6KC00_TRICU|nr:hypothetical protein TNCT_551051 [Trichonephila clavata]